MSDYNELRGFLSAACLRFQDHKSKIARHISAVLTDNPKLNQNRVPEAAPVTVSLPDFLPTKQTTLTSRWRHAQIYSHGGKRGLENYQTSFPNVFLRVN